MTSPLADQQLTDFDPRAVQLAESRYRNGYGPTLAEPWEQLHPDVHQDHVTEAAAWLRSAIAAGLMPPAESPTAIADANNPTQLRWGLDDVMWGDDDTTIVMLSDEERRPYWLELDQERAAVLRDNLAGPDGEQGEIAQLRAALTAIRHLHKDSPMGPCPVCIDADAVAEGRDGLMPYPCPTGRLAGAQDCDPPNAPAAPAV